MSNSDIRTAAPADKAVLPADVAETAALLQIKQAFDALGNAERLLAQFVPVIKSVNNPSRVEVLHVIATRARTLLGNDCVGAGLIKTKT